MPHSRYILLIILLMFISKDVKAQWDMDITQFWTVRNTYNPSFAGDKNKINVDVLYKMYWMDAKDAPRSILVNGHMPIKFLGLNHGVGITLSNTKVGKEQNSFLSLQYAYKHKIGKGWLNAGVQIGVHDMNFDANSYQLKIDSTSNNSKTIIASPIEKRRFDINAGISLTSKRFFVGAGIRHINEPKYYSTNIISENTDNKTDSTYSKIPISYNLMLGYNIKLLDTLFEIQPMILAQSVASKNSICAALHIAWNNKIMAGAIWRGDEGYSFFAGTTFSGVGVRYAYDMNKKVQGVNAGANHEVAVNYSFNLDWLKPKPQPHKSIRLL